MPESTALGSVKQRLQRLNYTLRTEGSYVSCFRQFILFYQKCLPSELGENEMEQFLTYLAVERKMAPSTQNQALSFGVYVSRGIG